MAELTLYIARGTIARAAHAALEEAGADYALEWLDFRAREQQGPAFLALNPKGRVPLLRTPRGDLSETPAILEWIADAHPESGLMPADPWQAAKVREVMGWLAATMHVAHAHGRRAGRWADDAAACRAMAAKVPANMGDCAAEIERQLDGDWIGAAFSVADLHLWAVASWLDGDGAPLQGFPRLAAHHARVSARPAVARIADAG